MKTMKKIRFGSQCVASQLKMSAVTVSPPTIRVIKIMSVIGKVYSRTMNRPYIKALNRPAAGEDEPFIKKEIVIGTIGKTQGVSNIAKPQRIASMIRAQRPFESPSEPSVGSRMAELVPSPKTD